MFNDAKDIVYLNTARNCLRYIIKAYNIRQIYLPYYTCPVVWQAVKKEGCKIGFYHIDSGFMPICDFEENDYIVYTNYFGICARNVKQLANKYKNLIIDNAQAFYMNNSGLASFNSIRKFFGNSDGALLFCDKKIDIDLVQDDSEIRLSELLRRKNLAKHDFCTEFPNVDEYLVDEPIKLMSKRTKTFFDSIDFKSDKEQRIQKFDYLHSRLSKFNELKFVLDSGDVPMNYPFMVKNDNLRKNLMKRSLRIEKFWSPINSKSIESEFQKYILPLPIDIRYSMEDMCKMVDIILEFV